jgi:poly(hydroxyalkanoate) depolymerase family esterase
MEYEHIDRNVNKMAPYVPLHQGTYELEVPVGNRKRRMLAYIPAGFRPAGKGVLIIPEDHTTADEVLKKSWWRILADTDDSFGQFMLLIVEPEDTWNTKEPYGDKNGDVAYLEAAFEVARQRYLFCIHESKFYLAGFGEGSVLAQMEAMYNPAVWSGLVAVGDCGVTEEYQKKAAKDYALNLGWFEDPLHRKNVHKGEIPMPVWLIQDPSWVSTGESTESYWKCANGILSTDRAVQSGYDGRQYVRKTEPAFGLNRQKKAYVVNVSAIEGAAEDFGNRLLGRVKSFLFSHQRWMGNAGGDLRMSHDYIREDGWTYHYQKIGGWMREWMVYVPEKVAKQPKVRVPVVFAMHGYTNTCYDYAGHTEWFRVADRYGFIVIHPTAVPGELMAKNDFCDPDNEPLPAWNYSGRAVPDGPDELEFFRTMLDQVSAEYCVDPERIYITGHSHGSQMTHTLALEMTDMFAAAAPCSGVLFRSLQQYIPDFPAVQNRKECEIPVWMFGGSEEEFLLSKDPHDDNETGESIRYWCKINHMDCPSDWNTGWTVKNERWHDLILKNKYGAPMVGFSWLDYMPHATMPEMSFRIWEEFFSHFRRVGGKIEYSE